MKFFNLRKCSNEQLLGVAIHLHSVLSRGFLIRVLDDSEQKVLTDIDLYFMGILDLSSLRSSLIRYYEN